MWLLILNRDCGHISPQRTKHMGLRLYDGLDGIGRERLGRRSAIGRVPPIGDLLKLERR